MQILYLSAEGLIAQSVMSSSTCWFLVKEGIKIIEHAVVWVGMDI